MKDGEKIQIAKNSINGAMMGAVLFFAGLFVTIWTWGFGGVIGVPMMLAGLALPFWAARQGRDGLGGSAVMTEGEARRARLRVVSDRTASVVSTH